MVNLNVSIKGKVPQKGFPVIPEIFQTSFWSAIDYICTYLHMYKISSHNFALIIQIPLPDNGADICSNTRNCLTESDMVTD